IGCTRSQDPPLFCAEPDCAPATCESITTRDGCDASPNCHSVFVDDQACKCAPAGCCTRFSRCAEGKTAQCSGPVACDADQPLCEGPYVVAYTGVCYEGCVLASECAEAPSCAALDEAGCSQRPDCVADYCGGGATDF